MAEPQTEFELVEPFDVDDGSLVGLSPAMCFTLGVEWEQFRQHLKDAQPFSILVIDKNADRLVALAERHGRFIEHHPQCEGWTMLIVGNQRV